MNKTEAAYHAYLLEQPDVARVEFEAVKLRLATGAWYTCDMWVVYADGREEMHEVKGFWREAARVRIKVAAKEYGWRWTFRAVQREPGGWKVETFAGE
jgi:hypothetical protein